MWFLFVTTVLPRRGSSGGEIVQGTGRRAAPPAMIGLAAIVALAAGLRFATLNVQSFSDDELFTVWLVKMSFGHMISTVPHTEATPPLFYALEWVSSRLFGMHEAGIRILPALAGTLTVPVLYVAGALGGSRRLGLAAAGFAAVDPFLIWYSQEARAYSLMILFVALGLMALLAFIRDGSPRVLFGWALASAAALATHYFALFLVAPEAVWLLLAGHRELRRRASAVAIPAVVAAALLPLALHQRSATGNPGGIGDRPLWQRLAAVPKNFLVGFSIPAETAMILITGALAALALGLALRRSAGDERRCGGYATALALCAVLLPLVIAPFGFDYLTSRNLIAVLVPAALVLGCGFAISRTGVAALAAFGAVSIATVVGVAIDPRYQRPNWRGAAHALGPAHGDRVLVFNPPFHNPGPFRVYFGAGSSLLSVPAPKIDEVDIVALEQAKAFGPNLPTVPNGSPPQPPTGFRLSEDLRTSSYRIVRFTAPRPRTVALSALGSLVLPGAPAVLVSQTPSVTAPRP